MLVIFDCDGVLVDSEPPANRVLRDSLARYGLDLPLPEVMARFVGSTMAGVEDRARTMGAELPPGWLDEIYRETFVALEGIPAMPGVIAAIDGLEAAGTRTCIASNGPMAKMEVSLAASGLWARFAGRIFSAHEVGVAKPDPGLFLHAARAMGVDPAETVVVEDSASGMKAAQAAGMRCLAFVPAGQDVSALGATAFHAMADLPDLVLEASCGS
ncbi:MAG: HAD family hydrolase [Rubricella sp.]